VIFEADYDEIEFQKYSYDVILVTSSPLRHRKRHQNNVIIIFPIWAPPNQNLWLRQWSQERRQKNFQGGRGNGKTKTEK